jgi:hypothetical protein
VIVFSHEGHEGRRRTPSDEVFGRFVFLRVVCVFIRNTARGAPQIAVIYNKQVHED